MSSITVTSNSDELMRSLEVLDEEFVEVLAEQTVEFELDLRGNGPGEGLTPFLTGRLLTSGETFQDGLRLVFENDAAEPGKESYAEFAHHSGDPTGGYATGAERAFNQRFNVELRAKWDDLAGKALG